MTTRFDIRSSRANHQLQFTIGRALAGGACGIVTAAAPVWQVEASSNTARGRVVISQIVASSCGAAIVSSALLSPSRNWENPDASFWRVVVALQCLPVVMSFLTLLISPESQRYVYVSSSPPSYSTYMLIGGMRTIPKATGATGREPALFDFLIHADPNGNNGLKFKSFGVIWIREALIDCSSALH